MATITGFPALACSDAKVLILGSMPSVKSLAMQQYYGHPRNAFWVIMIILFGSIDSTDYQQKITLLRSHKIALWDVLKHCQRSGSMDSAIDQQSIICNDFNRFFQEHSAIANICFNGSSAQKIFHKQVDPLIQDAYPDLHYHQLPSTSSAYAAMSLTQKTEHWRILQTLSQTIE